MLHNTLQKSALALASVRIFALFCAALQNIDFRIRTETSNKMHQLQRNIPRISTMMIFANTRISSLRMSSLLYFLVSFFKAVKTAVPDDGRPPRALGLTKLVE